MTSIPSPDDCPTTTSEPSTRMTRCTVDSRTAPARRGSLSRLTIVWERPVRAARDRVVIPVSPIRARIQLAMS